MTDHSVLDEPHYSATWVSLEFTLTVPLRIIYTLISSDFSLDKKYSNFCKIKIMIIFYNNRNYQSWRLSGLFWPASKIIFHRYGTDAAAVADAAFATAGNSYLTFYNTAALGPKSIAKRAAKVIWKLTWMISVSMYFKKNQNSWTLK